MLKVLVVDDSAVMRAMIRKTLRLSGLPLAEIHEASHGAEALQVLNHQQVDIALVDLNMPVMDGEALIERLRENPRFANLPVLVVSTEGSFTRISLLRQRGAEFVHKPFTPETLRHAVSELTGVTRDPALEQSLASGVGPDF